MQLVSILSRLNADSISPPVSVVHELIQWISTGKLSENELGSCWHLMSQLLRKYPKSVTDLRPLVLEFMVACMTHHSIRMGPILWKEFLKFASTDWDGIQDLNSRIKIIIQLTKDGRDVSGIEEEIGSLLASWLEEIVLHGDYNNSVLLLGFITNIFKFSRLYLDKDMVYRLLGLNRKFLERNASDQVITAALQLYDAVTRYGGMPESCLELIAHGLINLDSNQELTQSILKNILGSHLSSAFVKILVDYLHGDAEKEFYTIQNSIKLLSVWKWKEKEKLLEWNLSDYLLLSFFPKLMQFESFLDLILESIAFFLDSKSPLIIEWSLVIQCSCFIIPKIVGKGEAVYKFSKNSKLDQDPSIKDSIEFILQKIMLNFDTQMTQDKKTFCRLLLDILSYLDDEWGLFLIQKENDLQLLTHLVSLLLKRDEKSLVFQILEKIDQFPFIEISDINRLVDLLILVEKDDVFSNLLRICLRIPSSELLDQLSKILETHQNEDVRMMAAKGITCIWDWFCETNSPEKMDSAIDTYRRILSHFTDEKLPKNTRIYFGKFLCGFRAIRKRVKYLDMDKGIERICFFINSENTVEGTNLSILPLGEYLPNLKNFLNREPNWDVYHAILIELQPQLHDSIMFDTLEGRKFLVDFTQSLITMIQTDTVGAQLIDVPSNSKASDFVSVFLKLLAGLIQSYKNLFIKKNLDDAVLCFLSGLSRPSLSRFCMHSLTIAIYESPFSIMKYLSSILLKLSQMTSLLQGIENLEFLSHLGKSQTLHVNLTEDDYKRVFGIALQYLRVETNESVQSKYIVHLAHKVLSLWFVNLQIPERRIYLSFITKQLMINGLNETVELVLDTLAIYSFSDCEARSQISNNSSGGKTWLWGNTLITINNHPSSVEWNEITIRRPSGTLLMHNRLENSFISDQQPYIPAAMSYLLKKCESREAEIEKKQHMRSFSTGSVHLASLQEQRSRTRQISSGSSTSSFLVHKRRSISASSHNSLVGGSVLEESDTSLSNLDMDSLMSRDKRIDPSFVLAQMIGIPNTFMTDNSNLPFLLPGDESVSRALSVLDRTPVLDLHKIGVLYIDKLQKSETEILSNTCGSKAYGDFLESLGTWFLLKESGSLYSGGLDTSSEALDGPFALTHADRLSQCVFHVTTVMPSSPNDPMSTLKKRHIGNNFVNILWNESGIEYSMGTLEGQFNFVAIVIQPLSKKEFTVKVLTRKDIPNHFLFSEPRSVSLKCLGSIIRTLAIHCDTFSQMWINRFVSSPKERLTQIYRLRDRLSISKTSEIFRMHDFSLYL